MFFKKINLKNSILSLYKLEFLIGLLGIIAFWISIYFLGSQIVSFIKFKEKLKALQVYKLKVLKDYITSQKFVKETQKILNTEIEFIPVRATLEVENFYNFLTFLYSLERGNKNSGFILEKVFLEKNKMFLKGKKIIFKNHEHKQSNK